MSPMVIKPGLWTTRLFNFFVLCVLMRSTYNTTVVPGPFQEACSFECSSSVYQKKTLCFFFPVFVQHASNEWQQSICNILYGRQKCLQKASWGWYSCCKCRNCANWDLKTRTGLWGVSFLFSKCCWYRVLKYKSFCSKCCKTYWSVSLRSQILLIFTLLSFLLYILPLWIC